METESIDACELAAALALSERELISIVGGGGKTTTLFALGHQSRGRTVLTTTTKMGSERDEGFRVVLDPTDHKVGQAIDETGTVLVWASRSDRRATGVGPADCDRWFVSGLADRVIVEADGSRRKPFKAPYSYEPVVPNETTLIVACIGAAALGAPIDQVCLRPDAVTAICGAELSDPLTPERAAAVLLSDEGSRKSLPPGARYSVLVHQVTDANRSIVCDLVSALAGTEVHLVRRTR